MSVLKYIWFLLLAALVLGGFYIMALLGPSAAVDYTESYIDPTLEGDQLLKESEKYEKQFEQASVASTMSEEVVGLLRKSIELQERYIDKAKTLGREPADRLMSLRTRLHNIESAPIAETIESLEKNAAKAEEDGKFEDSIKLYRQAYDLQSKINTDYPLSKYKNIGKRVEFDRQVKMLEARPLYEKTVELEKAAQAALAKKDLLAAKGLFEKTIEAISQLHAEHPASVYTDFARLMRLESELASLRSGGLAEKIAAFQKAAKEAEAKKDFLSASEAYSDAAENQRTLNRLYPKSRYVSEEKVREFELKKIETYSWKFAKEIREQDAALLVSLRSGDIGAVAETSANLLRKTEHFMQNFPQSPLIGDEILMRMRYVNFMSHDIGKIRQAVIPMLGSLDGFPNVKMLRTEITQELYSLVMQENPSRFTNDKNRPVDSVTLEDANRFCSRVSWLLGYDVKLPTEKMYRTAIGSLRYADINEISWNNMNSEGKTHPVATRKSNDRGYYDLLGNVSEYVRPNVSLPDFVYIIGGGAQTSADAIGDVPMAKFDPKQRNRMVGFRIVVEYTDKKASK